MLLSAQGSAAVLGQVLYQFRTVLIFRLHLNWAMGTGAAWCPLASQVKPDLHPNDKVKSRFTPPGHIMEQCAAGLSCPVRGVVG